MIQSLPIQHRSFVRTSLFALAVLAPLVVKPLPARAADLAEQAHSLRQVPADSAFYSSSLRLKEQWDAFVGSKAYSKLMEIPVVGLAKIQIIVQWQRSREPMIAQVREYIESPAGKDAVAVLKEMFSDEVFAYGGSNIAESMKFFMELNSMARPVKVKINVDGEEPENTAAKNVLEKIKAKLSSGMSVPTFVVGFRIKNTDRAKQELDEVHSLLRNVLDEHQSELAAHLQRDQIAGHEFLTLRVDGSMIPWEKIREESEKQLDEEDFDAIRDAVSKQTVVIALGVVDEFVLLSVGATTDHLEKMGKGETLAENSAIKRLQKHADQKVVSLTYMSKAFAQSLGSAQQTMDSIANSIEQGMVEAKVDEEDRKTILDDIRSFKLAKYMPEPGETSAIAYLTGRGYEMFQYTAGTRPMMDSSKPLSILSHVGGSPALMIASRSKQNIEDYNEVVAWLKRIGGHAEAIAEKKADSDEWEKYQEFRDRGVALLERLDKTTREYLFPALADGQGALVMDLSATSQQWFEQMPEAEKPLPMLELAIVASVSDAEKLRQAVTTYIDVARDTHKLMKEIEPDDTPKFKLPKAKVSDLDGGGKLYVYPLPKKWGIDSQVAVNAGLTDTFAVASLMPKTTERLLKEKASTIDTSLPLDHPAALVTHIEFAKMIEVTRPWMDYGMDVATGKLKPKKDEEKDADSEDSEDAPPAPGNSEILMSMGFVVPQVQQFLDVATALRSATSMTYEEDGVWVTHSETHIEDLK